MKVFAKIVVGILMFAAAVSASAYTKETVKGNYSMLIWSGTAPQALLGVIKFDGAGNVSAIYAQSGGFTGTLSGTYMVDSDGTGTITFSSISPTLVVDFVLSSVVNGNAKSLQFAVSSGGDGVGTATHQ